MASIVNQKKEVFSSLAALKVINGSMPKLPNFNSLSSISNSTDTSQFLIDLLKTLDGDEVIKDIVTDTISYKLPDVERVIKNGLKTQLKELVSCNVNPTIPTWVQNGGSGVEMKVSDIDFYDMMKSNPESDEGKLIYTDISNQTDSKDFNSFLYYTIQNPSNSNSWGQSMTGNDILDVEFSETGTVNNNTVKFTTSSHYSSKKLPEFNNDFIDSLTLFGEPDSIDSSTMVALILEDLFGSISSSPSARKSKKQLKKEAEMKEVIDKIIDSENDIISDDFFEFDNPTLAKIENEVNNKSLGIIKLETCGNLSVQITSNSVQSAQDTINSSTNKGDEALAVKTAMDNLAEEQAAYAQNPQDRATIKSNFFTEILKKLVRILMNAILGPKFMTLFAINHQIIYGEGVSYDGPIDFLKKNSALIKNVSKTLRNLILNIMLKTALTILTLELAKKFSEDQKEKSKTHLASLLSYAGVPPSIIAQINQI